MNHKFKCLFLVLVIILYSSLVYIFSSRFYTNWRLTRFYSESEQRGNCNDCRSNGNGKSTEWTSQIGWQVKNWCVLNNYC